MRYLLFILYFTYIFAIDVTLGDARTVPEFGFNCLLFSLIDLEQYWLKSKVLFLGNKLLELEEAIVNNNINRIFFIL